MIVVNGHFNYIHVSAMLYRSFILGQINLVYVVPS